MDAVARHRKVPYAEDSESATVSANDSPTFTPLQNNSSRTSLASNGSDNAQDKEEVIKSTMELDADTFLVAPVRNSTEFPVATVDKNDLKGDRFQFAP